MTKCNKPNFLSNNNWNCKGEWEPDRQTEVSTGGGKKKPVSSVCFCYRKKCDKICQERYPITEGSTIRNHEMTDRS